MDDFEKRVAHQRDSIAQVKTKIQESLREKEAAEYAELTLKQRVSDLAPRIAHTLLHDRLDVPWVSMLPYDNVLHPFNYRAPHNGVVIIPEWFRERRRRPQARRYVENNTLTGWDTETVYSDFDYITESGGSHSLFLGQDSHFYEYGQSKYDGFLIVRGNTPPPDVALDALAKLVARHNIVI